MTNQHRREARERIAIPVQMGRGRSAMTRDMSVSGVYLEIAGKYDFDGPVLFRMNLSDSRVAFAAEGEVVRVEHWAGDTGVAVKFLAARLLPAY